MEYMPNGRKGSHRRGSDKFMDDDDESIREAPTNKKGKKYTLTNLQYEQVRIWLLRHSPKNVEWEEIYESYLQGHTSRRQNWRSNRANERPLAYVPWLRNQLQNEEMSKFKRLVNGPKFEAISYNAYAQNGYYFRTKDSEMTKTTQNSGVSMQALTSFRSSAKDRNFAEDEVTYYGIIKQILELDYIDFTEIVFYCDWVCIKDKVDGCVVDPETNLIFVNLGRFKSSSNENDEPFVCASEAAQVFYCKDPTRDNWYVVLDAPKRLTRDVDAYENPLNFEASLKQDALGTTLVDDIVEDSD